MSRIFDDLLVTELADVLQSEASVPGDSYLFTGPPGVGKAEAARMFAAAILCPAACGACDVCRRVRGGIHPDVQTFSPEGQTFPVEVIREVVHLASQTPLEADHRVFILEDAHLIAERSQNALLKALEEPNASVTWVLVADLVDTLLPTVISRCKVIPIPSPAPDAVAQIVSRRFGTSAEETLRIIRAARGDFERTLALASDESARQLRRLALKAATRGGTSALWALDTVEEVQKLAAAARDSKARGFAAELKELEETIGKGRGSAGVLKRVGDRHKRALRQIETQVFSDFLFWLATAFRDMAALGAGAAAQDAAEADAAEAELEAAGTRPVQFWLEMVEECLAAQTAIAENANAALAVEAVLLRLPLGTLERRPG